MDNPKSIWIWTDPIPKSKYLWIPMNINNNRGTLTITNDLLIIPHSPLVFLYFNAKAGKNTEQKNIIFYESTKKLEEQVK